MPQRIEQFLKKHRISHEFGALSAARKAAIRAKLLARIDEQGVAVQKPTLADVLRAPFFGLDATAFMKPIGVVATMFVFAFGWVGSLFASFDAVPGDRFYSLKIATEQVQLSLASSLVSETRLRIEFANRRADEVTKILETSGDDHDARVKEATQNLTHELAKVSERLSDLRKTDATEAVNLAKLMDRKVAILQQTIDASLDQASSPSVVSEVTQAQDAAKTASIEALTVLVEDGKGTPLSENLEKKVADRLAQVTASLEKTEKRLLAIQAALSAKFAHLAMLSDADRNDVQFVKDEKAAIAKAKPEIADMQALFEKKDFSEALQGAKSVADTTADINAKLEAFEKANQPAPEATVKEEKETSDATEQKTEPTAVEPSETKPAPEAAT